MKPECTEQPDRNTLALDRTVLANERTYQAWLRTGLAALVSGLGVAKFLKGLLPSWMVLTIAGLLLLFSTTAFLQAAWRYSHIHVRIAHLDIDAMPVGLARAVSIVLAGCSLFALASLLGTGL